MRFFALSPFLCKQYKLLFFVCTLLLSFNNLRAQSEKELTDFLHSGTITSQSKTVKIPIEIWNDLILLKAKVNGHDATFMWDNGFSVSGIDNSLVQAYQFRPYSAAEGTTATDGNNVTVDIKLLLCPKIEIGGIIISDTPFIKADIKAITMTKELKFEGVLGASVINKLNWKFDFDKNYVEISQKPFIINDKDLVLPFSIIAANNNHIMPITLNGNTTETLVDFGFNGTIEINTANAAFFSKADATKTFGPASISLSGIAPIDTIYTIKDNFSWELSGKKLNTHPKISFTKAANNVMIGNKLFRDTYNLVINISGTTAYTVTPRKSPAADKKVNKTYGYRIHNVENKFKIMSINANANTVNNDIKLLDEVISINGKVPGDFEDNYTLKMYQEDLLNKNMKMILKLKNGKEISLTPQPNTEYKFKNEKELW